MLFADSLFVKAKSFLFCATPARLSSCFIDSPTRPSSSALIDLRADEIAEFHHVLNFFHETVPSSDTWIMPSLPPPRSMMAPNSRSRDDVSFNDVTDFELAREAPDLRHRFLNLLEVVAGNKYAAVLVNVYARKAHISR